MTDLTPEQNAARRRHYSRGNPIRNVRLDDDRWNRVTTEATRTGRTASDVIRAALDAHLPA